MDIEDLKIGRDGTFIPPFKSNINTIKSYETDGYDSIFFADHILNWIPESIWHPNIGSINFLETAPSVAFKSGDRPTFTYDYSNNQLLLEYDDTKGYDSGSIFDYCEFDNFPCVPFLLKNSHGTR